MSLVASRMYNVLQVQVLQVQVEQFKFEIIVEIGCAPLLARPYHREYRARCSAASDKLIHHIMLHRMGSRPSADAEHCTLSPQTAKDERGPSSDLIWVDNLKNTLRRSRGAIGRYLAAPGASLAAARVPRRLWTAPRLRRKSPAGEEG